MRSALEASIKALAEKSKAAQHPHEAMSFAQAALNLAHADAVMEQTRRDNESAERDTKP